MKKIQVLMSTYNGELYIKEQIDSILNQEGVNVSILVRDDGSSDNTLSILSEYEEVEVIQGQNLGYKKSFLELMRRCSDADYYAFCDQDDVWDKDKLYTAVKYLEESKSVLRLYCGNTRLVDEKLVFLKNEDKYFLLTLGSALEKNFATGCTMVFNRKLLETINSYSPQYVSSHDSWVLRVCLALNGFVFFDHQPHISYRQHKKNVVGSYTGWLGKTKYRLKLLLKDKSRSRKNTANMLLDGYSDYINDKDKELLKAFAIQSIKHKIKIAFNKDVRCGKLSDDICFRIALFINWV